jgi:hypothetical protein
MELPAASPAAGSPGVAVVEPDRGWSALVVAGARSACPSALAKGASDRIDRPIFVHPYHAYLRSIRTGGQRVRTDLVLDVHNIKLCRRQPLQCFRYISRPDAPRRAVVELDDMAPVMLLDAHRSPVSRHGLT